MTRVEDRKMAPITEIKMKPPLAELVDRIMVARHGGMEPEVEAAWKTEVDRRIAEIESSKVKGVSPKEVSARIKKILKR
ncbi:MAG TPA: addiction module protein [Verrucomicrobiae bacterium]|nr:addiction module protein [Verrucomicrobiae bacterium]